jgi:hypothetical protein
VSAFRQKLCDITNHGWCWQGLKLFWYLVSLPKPHCSLHAQTSMPRPAGLPAASGAVLLL